MRIRSAFLVLATMVVVVAGSACSPNLEEASTVTAGTTAAPGQTGAAATTEQPPEPTNSPPQAGQQVIEVTVAGGTVTPAPGPVDVPLGSTVIIAVTTDADDELHVHGYELTAPLAAGRPSNLPVEATIPGQFEVELHGNGLLLFTLRVQ